MQIHSLNVSRPVKIFLALALLLPTLALAGGTRAFAAEDDSPDHMRGGAVYTMTNAASGNAVIMFNRSQNGSLRQTGMYYTGGQGSGDALGSQGSVILSEHNLLLFAVNAGSNEISVFGALPNRLVALDKVPSGGTRPVSLTVHRNVLYVLNAGAPANITGFRISHSGLSMISGSTRPLSGPDVGPAQVEFSPNGHLLAVTEKMTNKISTYVVGNDGMATGPMVEDSAGMTPFGFAFDRHGRMVVSEAFGGAPNASAMSSYNASSDGNITPISASVPTHQTAACWVVITDNGRYTYTTNTGSGTISGYRIAQDGSLSLLDPDGVTASTGAGSTPIDEDLTRDSRYLYVLASGAHSIAGFRVNHDGSLSRVEDRGNLPAGVVGLAVR